MIFAITITIFFVTALWNENRLANKRFIKWLKEQNEQPL